MAETLSCCVGVPSERERREESRRVAREVIEQKGLIPPLALEELRDIAGSLGNVANQNFLMVLLNNALWERTVASIPFDRRVLLLPQCLRDRESCPAELDEFGLLCEQCGRCPTGELMREAEDLGYVVLVAEGTTVVTTLLQTGQVDCVIGVSCLSTLERSFPYTVSAAIPALALPLIREGCDSTQVDVDWVREAVNLRSSEQWRGHLALDALRSEVDSWFCAESLEQLLQREGTQTEALAAQWMVSGGKRWRPFLATCVQRALDEGNNDEAMKRLAVAVECFHKASLVHDDIEDDEEQRYGVPAIHRRHGVPIALNVGDLLIGEGYRLIAECGLSADHQVRMLRVAAEGHRELCLGQGEELDWTHDPGPLTVAEVVEIFRRKTAPAFEVALNLGAICGGANDETCAVLAEVSRWLGIAYQIRDDIEDFEAQDLDAMHPSLLVALALWRVDAKTRSILEDELGGGCWNGGAAVLRRVVKEHGLVEHAWRMYSEYREGALAALRPLDHQPLKSLLFQLIHKILAELPADVMIASHSSRKTATTRVLPVGVTTQEGAEDAAL
ncbi:MAG: DUF116 domain-containing protein [bacterium]|nr:DUF116 domain-containing protein [bacterium]